MDASSKVKTGLGTSSPQTTICLDARQMAVSGAFESDQVSNVS
jgi:hypothetical protein